MNRELHSTSTSHTSLPVLANGDRYNNADIQEREKPEKAVISKRPKADTDWGCHSYLTSGVTKRPSHTIRVGDGDMQHQPMEISTESHSITGTHTTSLGLLPVGNKEHSDMTVNVSGGSASTNAGGVASVHKDLPGYPKDDMSYITAGFHYPQQSKPADLKRQSWGPDDLTRSEPLHSSTVQNQDFGRSTYSSRMQFDATYRGQPDSNNTTFSSSRRDSLPRFSDYSLECDVARDADIRKQESLKRKGYQAEEFEFATCESNYDSIRRASLRRNDWQVGYEGGISGSGYAENVSDARRRQMDWDVAEEGGIGIGRNYGVKKAGVLSTQWGKGEKFGIGDGRSSREDLHSARIQSANWGRGRRRYLSDSCVLDEHYDDDDQLGLLSHGYNGGYSSEENLRLPATPIDTHEIRDSYRKRSYSLPDELDDYEECWPEPPPDVMQGKRNLIESVRFITRPRSSLKRNSARRGNDWSYRRRLSRGRPRHPDEVPMLMRRGWFDVRKSIKVKVGLSVNLFLCF